ncbi:helix-turn-helix domain-containing protein [Gordonia sputi]|uniref:Putative Xre family transcriptional regulator n=2 Tax=Gordonia sputi TaxID=36823 RepID=H5U1Z1_9ACTN|nr:helix-turn-helix transcriptional regulator [Gordonia sputi]GAB39749.1 putative Xre family transcriptional regulator [Gordonia sputi NBRC 100414]
MPTPDPLPSDDELVRRMAHRRAFADVVRRAREARGLSQEALAERAEVSRPTIARIEGSTNTVTLDRLWALASALDTSATDLIRRTELLASSESGTG